MLYFSKLKLVIIYFIIIFLSLYSLANFSDNEDNFLLSKRWLEATEHPSNPDQDKASAISYGTLNTG